MARAPIGNPFANQIPTVSPTATPVDTYVRPVSQKGPLEALANTLSNIEKKATPALKAEQERRAEKAFKEGQRLYQENRIAIGEAVKKGLIDEGESPYLKKGYRTAQMNTMSMRYTTELESALERQKLYTTDDPKRIDQFVAKFQEQFIANNGMSTFSAAEMAQHFGTTAAKSEEVFRQAWREKHVSWQRAQNYAAFQREVAEATVSMFKPDMSDEDRKKALSGFAVWLEGKSAAANIDGMNNSKVLDTILTGVGIAVEKTGQTDILDVFKSTKFGTSAAASSLKVQAKLLDIEAKAIRLEDARAQRDEEELNTAYEAVRATSRSLLDAYTTAPTPENRDALTGSIDALMATPDDNNTALAAQLRKSLATYDTAQSTGGLSKTAESEIRIENALMGAKTFDEVADLLQSAANNGELTPADVTAKINKWRTQMDPALDEAFGLDFNTASSVEGTALRELTQLIRGNEYEMAQPNMLLARNEGQKLRQAIRAGVQLFVETNKRQPLPFELDSLTFNAQQLIIDRLIKQQLIEID